METDHIIIFLEQPYGGLLDIMEGIGEVHNGV